MILQEAMCLIQVKNYTRQKNKNIRGFSGAYPIDVSKTAMDCKECNNLIMNNIYVVIFYINITVRESTTFKFIKTGCSYDEIHGLNVTFIPSARPVSEFC